MNTERFIMLAFAVGVVAVVLFRLYWRHWIRWAVSPKERRLRRDLREIYPPKSTDFCSMPTPEQCELEAQAWERYGYPNVADTLRRKDPP